MFYRTIICILLTTFCRAQTPGKTVVFKVRAKPTVCTIECPNNYFVLEMNNPVVIKVKGTNTAVDVRVSGGQVMSVQDDTYYIRFTRPGAGLISVYQNTSSGRKVVATKMQMVKEPQIYFCGIKIDSTSKFISMKGVNFYAYSDYYKQIMPVVSFDMYYVDDTTAKKVVPIHTKSDTCMLSNEMRKRILSFQPHHNYIYFMNIICRVPDGSKRILDPIELNVIENKNDKENLSLIYAVRRKKV
ncbi:MAG: hypothetical protein ACXVPU_14200 [Bacteroidia bacterium]